MARRNERIKLIKELEKAGYVADRTGSGHWKVTIGAKRRAQLEAKGFDFQAAPAFVVMSCSPSDPHADRRARKDMRMLGYIKGEA